MKNLFLYASADCIEALNNSGRKALLIGGDFGYGNFGDVLQHKNSIEVVKSAGQHEVFSVMAANAINNDQFLNFVNDNYSSEGVIFVSEFPISLDEHSPKLNPVLSIRNLDLVYLYGGGFLNSMWGPYVLGVTEYFLRSAPGVSYLASGQQITQPFQNFVVGHIKQFSPIAFAVRDQSSQDLLKNSGFEAEFSFDDATESLIKLNDETNIRRGKGLILHLNSSGYTGNKFDNGIDETLNYFKNTVTDGDKLTLLQAYRDSRQVVYDTLESTKLLESKFPFYDYRAVDLCGLVFSKNRPALSTPIIGDVAFSCSYHVTLWMLISGIPCWLNNNNSFYQQKSTALQINQPLKDFLQAPKLADISIQLERRSAWTSWFQKIITNLPARTAVDRIAIIDSSVPSSPFFYKGYPRLEDQLSESQAHAVRIGQALDESISTQGILQNRLTALELDNRTQVTALNAHLTKVGHEARLQKERAAHNEERAAHHEEQHRSLRDSLESVRNERDFLLAQRHELLNSTSWMLTKPIRVLKRLWRRIFTR